MSVVTNEVHNVNVYQSNRERIETERRVEYVNKSLDETGKLPVQDMGKEQFLKLLITELKHQDPTNPMEDREFIAQMAQFSSLEQMLNFNKGMGKLLESVSFQSSFDLLGQKVNIQDKQSVDDAGNYSVISGTVDSVTKRNGEVFVKINNEEYSVNDLISVEGSSTYINYEHVNNEINKESGFGGELKTDISNVEVSEPSN